MLRQSLELAVMLACMAQEHFISLCIQSLASKTSRDRKIIRAEVALNLLGSNGGIVFNLHGLTS